jgi:hypothetical protein
MTVLNTGDYQLVREKITPIEMLGLDNMQSKMRAHISYK